MTDQELYEHAARAAAGAYAPYSNFNVGAAVLTRDSEQLCQQRNVDDLGHPQRRPQTLGRHWHARILR